MFIDKGKTFILKTDSGKNITVRLHVNPRAKRLILRIDQKKGEAVAVAPSKKALVEAVVFAKSKQAWIEAQLDKEIDMLVFHDEAVFPLRGQACKLSLMPAPTNRRMATLVSGEMQTLHLPGVPETLPARALRYLKKAARDDLTRAVAVHARRLGVKPARISIKDTRSRWGSCSARGNLSFSWRLILAEPFVLDYVAAHEVAHLIEMNHSPAFWAQVERTYPDWKPARDWLHTHGNLLHMIG
jgi:predicted metal-dependent hydrolase